jgi:FixJ family two-component response regulator
MTHTAPLVLVIDDDPSLRRALRRLLQAHGWQVEAFASAEQFLDYAVPDAPACIVLDVEMGGLNGLELQQALAERNIGLPIIFITGHGDIPMSVRAMKAGAADFLAKPFKSSALLTAIQQAIAGHVQARRAGAELAEVRARVELLTAREREVMALVVRGLLNKQVGTQLGVSEKTVKVHRARIMRKMQVHSLAELVRLSQREERGALAGRA